MGEGVFGLPLAATEWKLGDSRSDSPPQASPGSVYCRSNARMMLVCPLVAAKWSAVDPDGWWGGVLVTVGILGESIWEMYQRDVSGLVSKGVVATPVVKELSKLTADQTNHLEAFASAPSSNSLCPIAVMRRVVGTSQAQN